MLNSEHLLQVSCLRDSIVQRVVGDAFTRVPLDVGVQVLDGAEAAVHLVGPRAGQAHDGVSVPHNHVVEGGTVAPDAAKVLLARHPPGEAVERRGEIETFSARTYKVGTSGVLL